MNKKVFKRNRIDNLFKIISLTIILVIIFTLSSCKTKKYKVIFQDEDGSVLKEEILKKGEDATAPSIKLKEGYSFTNWSRTYNNVSEDIIVVAQYQKNKYVVIFKDFNGTVLKEEQLEYKGSATAPTNPTREYYTFTGWDKEFSSITGNLEVTALYEKSKYTVTFKDYDGEILKEDKVTYEGSATAPANPTREHYTFTGWDKEFSSITGNLVVTALYEKSKYTVTFKDHDGKVLKEDKVIYEESATAPTNPTREHYTFTGWDKEFSSITGNLEVTALYEKNKYTVTFKDYDGKVLKEDKVTYEESATAPTNPTRNHYTFTGWDKEFSSITDNLEVTALYEKNKYMITFKDQNDHILQETQIEYNTLPVYNGETPNGPLPDDYFYTFIGWDNEITVAVENKTYIAQFSRIEKTIDVWNGAVATSFSSGTGTMEDPYMIKTGAQLAYLAKVVNDNNSLYNDKYYELGMDLDLNNLTWTTIGLNSNMSNKSKSFKGVFDGNNHNITNYIVNKNEYNFKGQAYNYNAGLFGRIEDAIIRNFSISGKVDNEFTTAANSNQTYIWIGGIVSMATTSSVDKENELSNINCNIDINLTVPSGFLYIGGIIGYSSSSNGITRINNCHFDGEVNVSSTDLTITNLSFGGLTGEGSFKANNSSTNIVADIKVSSGYFGGFGGNSNKCELYNCYTKNNETVYFGSLNSSSIVNAGGAFGGLSTSTLKNTYVTGTLNVTSETSGIKFAGFVAYLSGTNTIDKCINDCDITLITTSSESKYVSNFLGYVSSSSSEPGTVITNCLISNICNIPNLSNYSGLGLFVARLAGVYTFTNNYRISDEQFLRDGVAYNFTNNTTLAGDELNTEAFFTETLYFCKFISKNDLLTNPENVWLFDNISIENNRLPKLYWE